MGATATVKRRLSHSSFVTSNFGNRRELADAKLLSLLGTKASTERLSAEAMEADLLHAEKNGGTAEISFVVRAFGAPGAELANAVSAALGGVEWDADLNGDESVRQW